VSSESHEPINALLDAVRTRLWQRRVALAGFWGASCAALLALLTGLLHRLHQEVPDAMLALSVAIPLLAALLWTIARPRPSRARAAVLGDRALRSRGLLVAAVDQIERPAAQRAGAAGVVLARAARLAGTVHAADVVGRGSAWSAGRPLLPFAIALSAAVLLSGPGAGSGLPAPSRAAAAAAQRLPGPVTRAQSMLAASAPARDLQAIVPGAHLARPPPVARDARAIAAPEPMPGLAASDRARPAVPALPAPAHAAGRAAAAGTDAGDARAADVVPDPSRAAFESRREVLLRREAGYGGVDAGSVRRDGPASADPRQPGDAVAPAGGRADAALSALSPALRAYADRYLDVLDQTR